MPLGREELTMVNGALLFGSMKMELSVAAWATRFSSRNESRPESSGGADTLRFFIDGGFGSTSETG